MCLRDRPPKEAALQGTYEVAWPVVTTVLTTVAAFVPFLLIPGTIGFFMEPLPWVVTFALLLSLLEVLFILPSHLSDVITPAYANKLRRGETPDALIEHLERKRQDKYNPRYYAERTVRRAWESLQTKPPAEPAR